MLSKYQKRLKLFIFESIHYHVALLVVTMQRRELELYINLKTLNLIKIFMGWLVKVKGSKCITFFCYHIFREKSFVIGF